MTMKAISLSENPYRPVAVIDRNINIEERV